MSNLRSKVKSVFTEGISDLKLEIPKIKEPAMAGTLDPELASLPAFPTSYPDPRKVDLPEDEIDDPEYEDDLQPDPVSEYILDVLDAKSDQVYRLSDGLMTKGDFINYRKQLIRQSSLIDDLDNEVQVYQHRSGVKFCTERIQEDGWVNTVLVFRKSDMKTLGMSFV